MSNSSPSLVRRFTAVSLCCLLCGALAQAVYAADEKKDGPSQAQARRLQQMQKQLEQERQGHQASELERGRLEKEKSTLDTQLKSVSGKLGQLKQRAVEAEKRSDALAEQLAAVGEVRDALTLRLADTEQKLVTTTSALSQSEANNRQLTSKLSENLKLRSVCEAKNQDLVKVGNEMVELYRTQTCDSTLLQREPFTQLKLVGIENSAENFREKLDRSDLFPQTKK